MMCARSIAFFSSRTFPGHACCSSRSTAAASIDLERPVSLFRRRGSAGRAAGYRRRDRAAAALRSETR
jgi:hypothetical protein